MLRHRGRSKWYPTSEAALRHEGHIGHAALDASAPRCRHRGRLGISRWRRRLGGNGRDLGGGCRLRIPRRRFECEKSSASNRRDRRRTSSASRTSRACRRRPRSTPRDGVVRLDEAVTRANLAIVNKGLGEMMARKARLESERDGLDTITFPAQLVAEAGDPDRAAAMDSESKLFNLRKTARSGQKAQLRERVAQLGEEITGLAAQQNSKSKEIALVERELAGVRDLWNKSLVQLTRLTALEREAARLDGERGQLVAAAAQAKGKIAETALQILQIDQDIASDVAKELPEVDGKIGEFIERKITAEDQLKRTDIRAPQDGTVFQLAVHTVGGVITAGDPIMLVVPEADNLSVEVKVNPQDIDQL